MATRKISGEERQLAGRLHASAINLLRKLRRQDARSGLNPARLSALSVVVFSRSVSLGELAAAEQVRPPTMTRIVQALTRLGLVRKRSTAGDGRVILIEATARGRRLVLRARDRRLTTLIREIRSLSADDRLRLHAALNLVDGLIEKVG
jgi:DNA-binding MarR family transcriptional regulator